jgi:hypothetical protein
MSTPGRPRFLYLHLPKTAGVSFRRVLEDSMRVDEILHVARSEEFGLYRDVDQARYRLIDGHLTFAQVAPIEGYLTLVTLREPIGRCLSTYDFWRTLDPTSAQWSPYARKQIAAAHDSPLAELCVHPDPEISGSFNNLQTWMLSGEPDVRAPMSPALLQRALANLARIDFVALASELEVATALLCWRFGLFPPVEQARLNVARDRTPMTDELRALLAHHNELDLQLVRHLEAEGPVRLARVDADLLADHGVGSGDGLGGLSPRP